MVGLYNTLCPNLTISRPRSKTQRLAWCGKTHLQFTQVATIFNSTIYSTCYKSSCTVCRDRFMHHCAMPRTWTHKNITLIRLSAPSISSSSSGFWRWWSLVMGLGVVGFLGWWWWWWTFAILGCFRCFLNWVHGILQLGFDHKVLLWALFHLPYRHAGLADLLTDETNILYIQSTTTFFFKKRITFTICQATPAFFSSSSSTSSLHLFFSQIQRLFLQKKANKKKQRMQVSEMTVDCRGINKWE